MYIALIILSILQFIVVLFGFYHGFISIFGLLPPKEVPLVSPYKKFAIVVPAHNEELVIEELIKSIKNQDYPKELYTIMVVCDNCSDRTSTIAYQNQVIVYERHTSTEKGKGYALQWMFDKIYIMDEKFDAIVILDADNLISENFLSVMNNMLCKGHKIIQGYLDSKNPDDSWITLSYAMAYWFMGRMWQLARFRLGLPNALGGTGMCLEINTLKTLGWDVTSLTEDLEFTMKAVLHGIKPVWAHYAKVYDEKPVNFKSSWKQRLRWMQGHWSVAFTYIRPLFWRFVKKRDLCALDSIFYLLQPSRILLSYFCLFVNLILALTPYVYVFKLLHSAVIFPRYIWIILFIIQWIIPPGVIIIMLLEQVQLKRLKGIIWYQYFALSYLPLTILGLFTRKNKVWIHTYHFRNIDTKYNKSDRSIYSINLLNKDNKYKLYFSAYLIVIITAAFTLNRITNPTKDSIATNIQIASQNETIKSQSIKQTFLSTKAESTNNSWLDFPVVAHALGSIDGYRATNSLEAMAVNYSENNMRVFEVDLILTSDDKLVARHDWMPYLYDLLGQKRMAGKTSDPLTYAEFMSIYSYGVYEPVDINKLISILSNHKDIFIITDTKYTDEENITKQFKILVDSIKKVNESILDKLIIQIYNDQMYEVVMNIYPFKNIIYATYSNMDSENDVIEFCLKNGITVAAVPVEKSNPEYLDKLSKAGIKAYIHTVNTEEEKNYYKSIGAYGIYSDYLSSTW